MAVEHPPYAVRAAALLESAAELGLGMHTGALAEVSRQWSQARSTRSIDPNRVVCDRALIDAIRKSALRIIGAAQLPMPWKRPDSAESKLHLDDAFDLLNLSQRKAHTERASFQNWQTKIADEITSELMT